MSPAITFAAGLVLLILFGWYFFTEAARPKRWLGLVLTVFMVAFCLEAVWPPARKIRLGLDLRGGTSFLMKLTPQNNEALTADLVEQAVEVIRKRVDAYGVSEPVITPQGRDRILVQIPGLDTAHIEKTKTELQRVAKLELVSVAPDTGGRIARIEAGEEILPPDLVLRTYTDKIDGQDTEFKLLIKKRAEISGEHVQRAYAYYDAGGYGVSFTLDAEGAKLFGDLTQALAPSHGQIAILLDGKIMSAPRVNEPIFGGSAVITGRFSDKEARDLASALENPLRVPLQIEETRSVSPTLGSDSVRDGIVAGLSGLGLIVVFLFLYYHFAGIIAILGLVINLVLLLGMMSMFHFVLTLPGIAGIILSLGMAVDANVLIYERLRSEMAEGKSLSAAIGAAYDKAFSAIFDANITTLIISLILIQYGSGSVRGFAITLSLGIMASMFSALVTTRTSFRFLVDNFGLRKLTMLNFAPKRSFDFIGMRKLTAIVSALAVLGSLGYMAVRGEKALGIDFRGGDLLTLVSEQPLALAEVRQEIEALGMGDITIQTERSGQSEMISLRGPAGSSQRLFDALTRAFPDRGVSLVAQDTVGPVIGVEFAKRSLWALALSFVGIFLYATIRFEFSFAVGAVVALIHDVIVTLGVFLLVGGELSLVLVGAILTIVGYSINDTIVIFDRIREAFKNHESGGILTTMNRAINETLSRTILTNFLTLLPIVALYFFGGPVLRDFSFTMIVGIFVGTYSTIFVASPIVFWWSKLSGKSVRREVLAKPEGARA